MKEPEPVNPRALYGAAPYDYAVVSPAAPLVFAAGACPLDEGGQVVAPGDFEAQTRQALDNLALVLAEAGSSLQRLLKTTVYVVASERSDLLRVWSVVEGYVAPARPPSTLLGVSLLGYAEQLVEIDAVALSSAEREGRPTGSKRGRAAGDR
ncbi:MAG: RidA family protein [Actinomycetota bacterium]|nr:RidA family protein [Actinomycetota bacterium]